MDISLALSISFHFVSKPKKKTGSIPVLILMIMHSEMPVSIFPPAAVPSADNG